MGLVAVFLFGGCGDGASDETAQASAYQDQAREMQRLALSPPRALGQLLVGRYFGTRPPRELLVRVRAGRLGGVILFADNVAGGARSVRRATLTLQRAALAGGNPPLLITIDQEGGIVKRLPGPPHVAPPDIRSTAEARRQGRLTGRYLRRLGINVNLAPVADVPSGETFIRERTFGSTPEVVAQRACAFARGLLAERVGATLKHFPGLGRARDNTDDEPETVDAPPAAIRAGYAAYSACGPSARTLTMVSSARYPRLTGPAPAVTAPATYTRELPFAGARGVTISDDLEAPALDPVRAPATRSIRAGLNLALYASTETGSATAYEVLLDRIRQRRIHPRLPIRNSRPVLALKALLEPTLTAHFLAATRS